MERHRPINAKAYVRAVVALVLIIVWSLATCSGFLLVKGCHDAKMDYARGGRRVRAAGRDTVCADRSHEPPG